MTRLHFGCFNCPREGWLNTDITPHIFVARIPGLAFLLHVAGKMTDLRLDEHRRGIFRKLRYLNVSRPWPYVDDGFEAIYSSHVLEHLTLQGARHCLAECFRTLRIGGVIRIAVPDLDALIRSYESKKALEWAIELFEADQLTIKNMHHFMYNFESLQKLLHEAGFVIVDRREYRQGRCPEVESMDSRMDSLFVEAIK
jgi:predicted SAM-dependent methyltransferase